jgi:hypothetical protein
MEQNTWGLLQAIMPSVYITHELFNDSHSFIYLVGYDLLYHFDQFGMPCYTLHTCRNFLFGTSQKWPLHTFFLGTVDWIYYIFIYHVYNSILLYEYIQSATGIFCEFLWNFQVFFPLPKWIRHVARSTVTSVTFRRFRMDRYALLPNWSKYYRDSNSSARQTDPSISLVQKISC